VRSSDGFKNEMDDDYELELVFAGGDGSPALTELLTELRASAATTIDERVAREHVTAAAKAARPGHRTVLPFVRRRDPASTLQPGHVLARATMAAAAVLALVVSLGSAGLLPARVQATVADIADHFGIDLPDPDEPAASEQRPADDESANRADPDQPELTGVSQTVQQPSSPTGAWPPATTPAVPPSRGAAGTGSPGPPAGAPAAGPASDPSGAPSANHSQGPLSGLPVDLPHVVPGHH
jgi:hypothetical protein